MSHPKCLRVDRHEEVEQNGQLVLYLRSRYVCVDNIVCVDGVCESITLFQFMTLFEYDVVKKGRRQDWGDISNLDHILYFYKISV